MKEKTEAAQLLLFLRFASNPKMSNTHIHDRSVVPDLFICLSTFVSILYVIELDAIFSNWTEYLHSTHCQKLCSFSVICERFCKDLSTLTLCLVCDLLNAIK